MPSAIPSTSNTNTVAFTTTSKTAASSKTPSPKTPSPKTSSSSSTSQSTTHPANRKRSKDKSGSARPTTPSANRSPIVHSLYEPTTQIWQYVIADPTTLHCVIIDPVREHSAEEVQIHTTNADALLNLIAARRYRVDHILETNASPRHSRSAAWYMRMQLLDSQGYAPGYSSLGGTASALARLFDRKYGDKGRLAPHVGDDFVESESVAVGRMRIYAMDLPGFSTEKRRVYIIGPHVFGAHGVAMGTEIAELTREDGTVLGMASRQSRDSRLWASIQTVLSMPETVKIFFDSGPATAFAEGPFDTIARCRLVNRYVGLNLQQFVIRREGERRAIEDEATRVQASGHGRKKSKDGTLDTSAGKKTGRSAPLPPLPPPSSSSGGMKSLGFAKKKSQKFDRSVRYDEWSDRAQLIGGRQIAV